jgi:hypothetical protein
VHVHPLCARAYAEGGFATNLRREQGGEGACDREVDSDAPSGAHKIRQHRSETPVFARRSRISSGCNLRRAPLGTAWDLCPDGGMQTR